MVDAQGLSPFARWCIKRAPFGSSVVSRLNQSPGPPKRTDEKERENIGAGGRKIPNTNAYFCKQSNRAYERQQREDP